MPFFSTKLFAYSWTPEKWVGPYSIISSNPNLNGQWEVINKDSYFNWLEGLYSDDEVDLDDIDLSARIENRPLMLKAGLLSRLLIPFSARYLVYDTSMKRQHYGLVIAGEKSLSPAFSTEYLRVYKPDFDPGYFWGATATVQANSFYDNLAITQRYSAGGLEGVTFTDGESYFGGLPFLSRMYGAISLNDNLDLLNRNPGFEILTPEGQADRWAEYFHNPEGKITTDKEEKAEGARSLKIVNDSESKYQYTSVITDEVSVVPNEIYAIRASVKCSNANWTHLQIQGFDKTSKRWVKLASCPNVLSGNLDWRDYDCALWIPRQITKIRPILSGGWVKEPGKGSAVSWFDNVRISKVEPDFYAELDARAKPPKVKFKKLSASKYEVTVKGATRPFVLVQSESFNRLWVARTEDGRKIKPIPLYATINGYPIDQMGDFKLTIEFEAQNWFSWGLALTLFTLLLCGVYLVYDWRRKPVPLERRAKYPGGKRSSLDKGMELMRRALSRIRRAIEEPRRHRAIRGK
jgi:hypothetical protein